MEDQTESQIGGRIHKEFHTLPASSGWNPSALKSVGFLVLEAKL